jgi:CoA:oxalate CoA-transferase
MKEMLAGIKVVDLTSNFAGPVAAAMLGDYGAEVIKIEKPKVGDDCRAFPPKMDNISIIFAQINRGKKSVVLDMKDERALEVVKKMIADADVLLESSRPGVMRRLGLDYDMVKQIKPDIIYCSVSAFGSTGPNAEKPGYDLIAQAYSGFMQLTGDPDGPPMKCDIAIGDMAGAYNAYGAIMTALYYRKITGIGQHIDVSLARSLLYCNPIFEYVNIGRGDIKRNGSHHSSLNPYGMFEGNNGQTTIIAALSNNLWKKLCVLMGREDMIENPKYIDNFVRVQNQKETISVINNWLKTFDNIEDAVALLDKAGIPNHKVYSMDDIAKDPHALACNWLIEMPVPKGVTSKSTFLTKNVSVTFSEAPGKVKPGPDLGEHNYEVLTKYGMTKGEIDELQAKWSMAQ